MVASSARSDIPANSPTTETVPFISQPNITQPFISQADIDQYNSNSENNIINPEESNPDNVQNLDNSHERESKYTEKYSSDSKCAKNLVDCKTYTYNNCSSKIEDETEYQFENINLQKTDIEIKNKSRNKLSNNFICNSSRKNNNKLKSQQNALVMDEMKYEIQSESRRKDYDNEVVCGWDRCCSPEWLQPLANKKIFLFLFCITCALQGMYYTYFVSVLTTMEKLLQIKSKTTGMIMSATEMGQIGGALLLSYYGGQGHRPKWIAWGMVLFSFSAFLCAVPHFIYGSKLLDTYLKLIPSEDDPLGTLNFCQKIDNELKLPYIPSDSISSVINSVNSSENSSEIISNPINLDIRNNSLTHLTECNDPNKYSIYVLGIYFIALLGVGIGHTAVYNLGIPYIDDNVASRDSPLYFAVTIGVRIIGPTLGFFLGSFCSRIYVIPNESPSFSTNDPRWIGAWWLGHLIVSSALVISSLAMFMFPKKLKKGRKSTERILYLEKNQQYKDEDLHDNENDIQHQLDITSNPTTPQQSKQKKSFQDFVAAIKRLLKNRILLLRTGSSVLHILPIAGLYTFLPKYLENQFRLPVASAAMISGVGGILVMGIGIFFSGFYIRKMSPSPKSVAAWTAFTALAYSLGMVLLMFLGCSSSNIKGYYRNSNNEVGFEPICSRSCGTCDDKIFSPVCSEGETYFSACHLGCSSVYQLNNSKGLEFSDCDCVEKGITVKMNYCENTCQNLPWYILVFSIFVIIHSSSEVGGMLITLRCVHPNDKAMALGLISVAIGLFGNVPCTIIYGAVVDSACINWREQCSGQNGACQLYDTEMFRTLFHGMTAGIMFLAFLFDVAVWYNAKYISFDEAEDTKSKDGNGNEESTPSCQNIISESRVKYTHLESPSVKSGGSQTASPGDKDDGAPLLLRCSTTTSPTTTPIVVVPIVLKASMSPGESSVPVLIERTPITEDAEHVT